MYTKLPVVESTHSTKTTLQKRLVSAYFVAFSTGYPEIYISAWLHGAKQNVTTHSTTAYRDRSAARVGGQMPPVRLPFAYVAHRKLIFVNYNKSSTQSGASPA